MNQGSPSTPRCLDATVIDDLASGKALSSELAADAASHLASCRRCSARLERTKATAVFLASVRERLVHSDEWSGARSAAEGTEIGAMLSNSTPLYGYSLLDEISRGGQCTVYRARHELTGRVAAVKAIRTRSIRDRARLEREAALMSRMRHPNIVTVYACGTLPDGAFAIAMEFIDGLPLDDWAARVDREEVQPRAALRRKLTAAVSICEAVAHANRLGVIHRDLKPRNVLVDTAGQPRVLDFGVSHETGDARVAITRTGEFAGTLAYASPEQIAGTPEAVDIRSDVYALGVVVYELVTASMPYSVDGPVAEVVRTIAEAPARFPMRDSRGQRLDRDLATILLHALSKEPERRYPSAEALGADIRRHLDNRPIDARRDSTLYLLTKIASRYRLVAAMATLIVVLIAVAVIALTISYGEAARARARADANAAELAKELRASKLRQGVMLATSGDLPQAERVLWGEVLDPSSPAAIGAAPTDPEFQMGIWALRQQQDRSPCLASTVLGEGVIAIGSEPDDSGFVVILDDGQVHHLRVPDLRSTRTWTLPMRTDSSQLGLHAWFDPAVPRIVVVDGDQTTIQFVNLSTGSIEVSLQPEAGTKVTALGVSAEGRVVVLMSSGTMALVSRDGRSIETSMADMPASLRRDLVVTGTRVSYHASPGRVICVDLASGRRLLEFTRSGWAPLAGPPLAVCPNGDLLFNDGGLQIRHAADGVEEQLLPFRDSLLGITVSRDGRRAACWRRGGTLWICDLATVRPPFQVAGNPAEGNSSSSIAAFSADGSSILTGGDNGVVRLWATNPARGVTATQVHGATLHTLAAGSAAGEVWSVGGDNQLRLTRDGATVSARNIPTDGRVVFAAVSPDERLLATEERRPASSSIVIRRMDTLEPIMTPIECVQNGGPLAFSPDSRTLIAGAGISRVALVDCVAHTTRFLEEHGKLARCRAVRLAPDGQRFACATLDGRLFVGGIDATALSDPIETGITLRSLAFSPDGKQLVTGHDSGQLMLWDVETGARLGETMAHDHWPMAIAYSPDGQLIASASYSGELCIWTRAGFQCLARLRFDGTPIHCLAFSRDGTRVHVGDDLGKLVTWDLAYGDPAIAASVEFWIGYFQRIGVPTPNAEAMRAWARGVLYRQSGTPTM